MAKTLRVKEAKLVKATAEGKNQTEAGLIADDNRTPESARVWANETLQKATVQEALQAEMARQGISLELIIKPIKDGLEAEKVSIVGNGDQAMAEITPDHAIRLKSSQMAQTLLGANKNNAEGASVHYHLHQSEQREKYGF